MLKPNRARLTKTCTEAGLAVFYEWSPHLPGSAMSAVIHLNEPETKIHDPIPFGCDHAVGNLGGGVSLVEHRT